MSNQYLSFDVTKQSAPQQLITGRQGDSQLKFVSVLLWDGDKNTPYDLTGKQVVFEALKPDGTHIVDYEGITILDAPHGLFRYSFNEQVFAVAGKMQQALFKITHTDKDDQVIADSTLEINIHILENRVEFGINSTDYLSEYDGLIAQVKQKFTDYAATVQDSIDKANALHDQIVEYTDLINAKGVILAETFGDVKGIKQPIGANFVEKLNNEFYGRGINPSWYHTEEKTVEQAIEQAIAVATEKKQPLILTEDYEIGELTINDSLLIIGNGHTITTKPYDSVVDNFIKIEANNNGTIPYVKIHDLNIKNISSYNVGLFNNDSHVDLTNVYVAGFLTKDIYYKKVNVNGIGHLSHITCEESPIGIDLQTTDVKLDHYQGHNCLIHINGVGGNDFLTEIHGWNWKYENKNWVDGSCLIKFSGSSVLSNVFADSVETAFILPEGDSPYSLISMQNVIYFLNKDVHPVKVPKLFSNLDDYAGKLNVNGIEVDANGWHNDNGLPEAIIGTIEKGRMNFNGLMSNGFLDGHHVTQKYSINDDFFNASDEIKSNVSKHTFIVQQGAGSVYIDGSLPARVPVGGKVGSFLLTDNVFQKIDTFVVQGGAKNINGTMLPLGIDYNKNTHTITIYNVSNSVYDGAWNLQMVFNSHAY